ncbi:hypothetical protein BGZ96_002574 [Linnemannia gamsii]|uniref:RFX-type winged-helix domain-containing protein n=1 Tax=Linnemannia gamsii TaxID=64522 RepID=A0ABQ7JKD8_9FUNG|nr:hypothetical protein BGZ96_002574 [Linnemannia gamsii]
MLSHPELWRDIHNNVRKMDDLYDATFYTWLKSEDNVLVTASYLQRLAGEYDHDRIEHALCWLVHGWRLESIAVLVKQVTFDWIHVHGEQGEKNRARLVLALTDNWAIQYIARLAGTLLTSAATPSPPPTLLTFTPCHSRMASLPGSPVASPSLTSSASAWGSSPQSAARSGTTFSQPLSTPSSPRSSHQLSTFNTPQPSQGRRMAVSRRLGSPMAMASAEEVVVAAGRPASMSPAAESHANNGYRSNHHRQSSSTIPGQQQHQAHRHLLQQRTSSSSLSSDHTHQGIPPLHPSASSVVNPASTTASDALSIAAAATSVYPSPSQQQPASYHPHHCTVTHPSHHHQHPPPPQPHVLSPQLQHHRQALHRAPVHIARTTHGPHATHVRQSSQPGNISTSKQHWLQQQSTYVASPIFYMNKSLFMEELSRKWSFCRLSEFFQCLDPASGINHRFKCKLLKESGLKDELSQRQKMSAGTSSAAATGIGAAGKDTPEDAPLPSSSSQETRGLESDAKDSAASISVALMDESPSGGSTAIVTDGCMDIVMTDSTASSRTPITTSSSGPTSVVVLSSAAGPSSQPTSSTLKDSHIQQGNALMTMHPLDTPMETVAVTCSTSSSSPSRSPSVSAPIPLVLLQQEQVNASVTAYRPLQTFCHGQQQHKDDMRSGASNSRGFRNADGNHQHSRAQTVEAIMSKTPSTSSAGPSGLTLSSASSTLSCNSTVSSPMPSPTTSSTMAASASLSNLSLTEQPSMEPTSRPLSQQQNLSPYTTQFSGQGLYRHGGPPHSVPAASSSTMSSSASTTATSAVTTMSSASGGLLTIHTNGQQQHQQQQGQPQQQSQRHHPHDSTSAKRKNSLGVSLVNSSNCSSFSSNGSSSVNMHSSSDGSLSSSSAIFPGPRRTSTSASTTNEDLKRLRCSRQNSTSSSTSGI